MKIKILVILFAISAISQASIAQPNPNRTAHVEYNIQVWGPGTLDMGDCPSSVDFTFRDFTSQNYDNYDVGYGDINCTLTISGRDYKMQLAPGVIDYKPTAEHPEGYKEFIQYVILNPVDHDVIGLDMNAFMDMAPNQTTAYMSQTGDISILQNGKVKIIDRLRFNFKMIDP